jgi:integrase
MLKLNRSQSSRRRHAPPIILAAEVDRLLAQLSPRSATGLRARALVLTLQRCGLRCGELCRLREADVADGQLRIVGTKRNRSRVVGVEPITGAALAAWITRRAALGIQASPLFASLQGRPIGANAVRQTLRRLAARAGVEGRVIPMAFRRGWMIHLFTTGRVHLSELQVAAGHASALTTHRYLGDCGATTAVEALQAVRW